MAGSSLIILVATFAVAQADVPAVPPPPVVVPETAEPATRFGEACLLAARRTLSGNYEFRLKGVEDRTSVGEREIWIGYEAVRIDSGAIYQERFGCLFLAIENADEIVLERAANNTRLLGEGAVTVLNRELAAAGFQAARP